MKNQCGFMHIRNGASYGRENGIYPVPGLDSSFSSYSIMVFCKGKGDCEQVGYVSNLLLVLQSIKSKLVRKDHT